MRLLPITAASLFVTSVCAVFADEAWSIDYHYALLGRPLAETTFLHQPNPSSPAALVYTLSAKGVLGAVNPKDGTLVWRQLLSTSSSQTNTSSLRAGQGQDVVISGYEDKVAAWSAADGRQVWQLDVQGHVEDVEVLEIPDGKETSSAKDAVVLSSGESAIVQRVDGASGAMKWKYKIESGDVPYQVSASSTEIFAILLHKTMLGYIKIKVVSLDPVDGRKTDEYTLSSENELASSSTIISVGANSASPVIAWTDESFSTLKINIVGTKNIHSFNIEKRDGLAVQDVRIHAPYHVDSQAHFLVQYSTAGSHWADVYHINLKKGKIEKAYSLPNLSGPGAFATTTSDANVYFTRISTDQISVVSSVSHGILGSWPVQGFGVSHGPDERVFPVHAVSELSIKGDKVSAIRSPVLVSSGEWVLLRDGSAIWQRPESLAGLRAVTFAVPSAVEDFAHQLEIEAVKDILGAYIHRVTRHLGELQRLPAFLTTIPQRFMRGFLGTTADGDVTSDIFGFHKIIACATENGRIIAMDAGSPDTILWSRKIVDLGQSQSWQPKFHAHGDGLLALSRGHDFPILMLNATTGESIATEPFIETSQQKHEVQYTLRDGELSASMAGENSKATTSLWHFTPAPNDRILSLVPRPVNDPVASIGKVLGDRRVLYKYLDPNLALLVTANDASSTASIFVLNTVSGAILHSASHAGVDLQAPISSIVSENWFAYSFTAETSESAPKGYQLVVGELFESIVPNDRAGNGGSSNFSSLEMGFQPVTLSHTYQIPESISKLSVTQTTQGITSRQLLAVLPDSHSIVGIPYGALDPRRPVNRDPTKDEQMEGLVRYSPVIDFDPQWYLNHQRELFGIKEIVTTPALLESTSIVFASGLDIFGTRLSPSFSFDILGKGFNKFQMLATVAGLAVATFVVAPLVMRKQIDTRWKFM